MAICRAYTKTSSSGKFSNWLLCSLRCYVHQELKIYVLFQAMPVFKNYIFYFSLGNVVMYAITI